MLDFFQWFVRILFLAVSLTVITIDSVLLPPSYVLLPPYFLLPTFSLIVSLPGFFPASFFLLQALKEMQTNTYLNMESLNRRVKEFAPARKGHGN